MKKHIKTLPFVVPRGIIIISLACTAMLLLVIWVPAALAANPTFVNDNWDTLADNAPPGLSVGDTVINNNDTINPGTITATYGVDGFGTVTSGSSAGSLANADEINDAIASTDAAGTLNVLAGTYNENIVLNKQLTLLGEQAGTDACERDGAVESIITGSGTLLRLQNGSAGAIIDGFTFDGGAKGIESSSGPIDNLQLLNNRFINFTGSGVFLNDSGDDITVNQNRIDGSGQTGGGGIFHLDQDTFDGFHFTNNCVFDGATGFFVDGTRNVGMSTARAPLFQGNLFERNGAGMNIGRKAIEGGSITQNTFHDNDFDGLQGGPKDMLISENVFSNNGRAGLRLTGFGGTTDPARGAQGNTIIQNCFTMNGFEQTPEGGIRFDAQFAGTVATNVLNNNNIFENAVGVRNSSNESIDAQNNWWDAADGPSGDGPGSGDAVIDEVTFGNIDFNPFLTMPQANTPCIGDLFDTVVECLYFFVPLNCANVPRRDRAACNQEQLDFCELLFP